MVHISVYHKIFKATWVLRGSPKPSPGAEPPLSVDVSCPKLELDKVTLGFAQLVRLNRLKISTRNSILMRSVIGIFLKIEKSTDPKPGP